MIESITKVLSTNLGIAILGIFGLLATASIVSLLLKHLKPDKDHSELRSRVRTWWMMVALFAFAVVVGRTMSLIFFAFMSFLAIKEFLSLIPTRRADRRVLFWAYLIIPVQYYWISIEWYGMFIIFIPVYMFLFFPLRMILHGETEGFLKAAGTLHWGVMICIFSLSHASYLLALPPEVNPVAGNAGLLLYLVFLTEINDVSQYIWGKSIGKTKVVPKVSPNKTWGGLLGGILTTTLLAVALSSLLTPISLIHSVFAGLLISISGFIGDVVISAVKRDLTVKDSGSLLPGHGGILDRVDSLSYTAPLFFHFFHFFYC